jgi:hypothetical protein
MTELTFLHLNPTWNADPNVPEPEVLVSGADVELRFRLNHFVYEATPEEVGILIFRGCSKWRLSETNDEGWYLGQCRYSRLAPNWGEFYELLGHDPLAHAPADWETTAHNDTEERHFLFYLRDETFECFAKNWEFSRSQ